MIPELVITISGIRTKPGQGVRRRCGMAGNHRPKSRGRDRRPWGEQRDLATAPAPTPAGTSQGNGKRAKQHSARKSGTSQSERTTANEGFPADSRHVQRSR